MTHETCGMVRQPSFFCLAFIGAGGPGLRAPWIRYWIPPTTTPVTGNSAAYYLCYK